jgi:very-short-patch-repair endonuclease
MKALNIKEEVLENYAKLGTCEKTAKIIGCSTTPVIRILRKEGFILKKGRKKTKLLERNCLYCGKQLISKTSQDKTRINNGKRKYCTKICAGHVNGKKSVEISKKEKKGVFNSDFIQRRTERYRNNKTGCFFNSKIRSEMGIRGMNKCRKERLGACFNLECAQIAHKKSIETNKNNKTGLWGIPLEVRIKHAKLQTELNRKNKKSCFFDKELQSKAGKIGGIVSRDNKRGMFNMPEEERRKRIREWRKTFIFPIHDTKIEVKVQDFLKTLGIEFFTHQYIKEISHAYQCDILIPSTKTIIECDGDYWHGNTDKYPILEVFQLKQREEDKIRTKELIEKGYRVLRLWEHEIKQLNLEEFKACLQMR